ncbi:ribonuclease Y [Candidatus Aquicultor secundus]|uniref:ribonuclease Y n=1 Tax=Candidatus Aquicultor secundus TaxID=1973895 RepID=UPI000CC9369E|nr:ribonuclease Y [Candidatus Aquicultor secundus]PIU27806.1 MAG: ribonuclease Y [Candidatus Aquicultor secundus]PIX51468.1 MAG: ribonuclease Y [Candidatus Aquicultor secundus]
MGTAIIYLIVAVIAAAAGYAAGYFIRRTSTEAQFASAEEAAKRILSEAEKEAASKKKEALINAKDEIHALRSEAERELRDRRNEIQRMERRLSQKEESLDGRSSNLDRKERSFSDREKEIARVENELSEIYGKELKLLEQIAGLSAGEARQLLLKRVEDETRHEVAMMIRDIEAKAKDEAEKRARNVVALAIQRCAADHVAETTVSVVPLPSDEMKGRIIGREGRNIRAFENLSGINLIIDDTPGAVILSSFDPVRREIARLALERLIADGRIHPARIEQMYEKARDEVEAHIREVGEQATFDTDIHGLHPELVRVLGRLKYRTSYGQNVLQHSIEVAHLAGIMAAELGADIRLAKRAGLLHDIGKAIDHEVEGPHAVIGAELARRFHEQAAVVHPIEAHHGEIEPQSVEAVLVQAADAISGARPGARRETLESYVKRLEKLETIAESYRGVEKCYAMQAGRELRIMVKPEDMDDASAALLARDVAKQIESELEYPGQIKVVVIREHRAIEYAK